MILTKKIINDEIEKTIKKYRALKEVSFKVNWNKTYYIQQEIEKLWNKLIFLKNLKKVAQDKK